MPKLPQLVFFESYALDGHVRFKVYPELFGYLQGMTETSAYLVDAEQYDKDMAELEAFRNNAHSQPDGHHGPPYFKN